MVALTVVLALPVSGASATTNKVDCDLDLPTAPVDICVEVGDISYLLHVLRGAGDLDGLYEAWCVDVPGSITVECYDVQLVSSLDPVFNDVIEAPENWDLINYLLNQVPTYRTVYGASRYDLQWVFWSLSNPGLTPSELPDDQTLADMILDQVRANGEGYLPGDGEVAAVAVVHADPSIQETIIPVRIVCTPCVKTCKSDKSGKSCKSGKSAKSCKSGKSGKSAKSCKSGKSGKSAKSGKRCKSGKSAKSGKSGKSAKSGKHCKSGKSAKSAKSDKGWKHKKKKHKKRKHRR